MTIVTVSPKREKKLFLVMCDNDECDGELRCEEVDTLPEPWRAVEIKGWVGEFHACSDACEVAIQTQQTIKEGP